MNIFLVRHAHKDTGQKETPQEHFGRDLTALGREQALCLASHIKEFGINKIISSDMTRAIATAQIVSQKLQLPISTQVADLREADPCPDQKTQNRDEIKKQCWFDWNFKPLNGESYEEGRQRFAVFIGGLIRDSDLNDNILTVSHGRVLRLFLCEYLDNGLEIIKTPYAHVAVTHLSVKDGGKFDILRYNDNTYLPLDLRI